MGLAGKTAPSFYDRMNKKHVYRIISVLSLLVMVLALLSIAYMLFLYQKSNREYQALAEAARAAAEETALQPPPGEAQPEGETPPEEEELIPIPVNFAYLLAQNEDIAGWIEVDGTAIDYPILYDDTQLRVYLNRNYLHAYTPYGSVFMLGENSRDFSDFNTVIYGHNMLDGSMFASLHNFEEQDFFDAHRTILIYTPDRVLTYQIFAAYRTDNLNLTVKFPCTTREERQEYIDHIFSHEVKAIFDRSVEVTPDDRIITLSTCIANPLYRYLVQGVLISDQAGYSTATAVG